MLGSPTPQTRPATGIYALLILQQFIGSSTHLVAQHALHQLLPATALFWRALLAALTSLFWLLPGHHWQKILRSSSSRDYFGFVLLGALAVPLNQWGFFTGVRLTAAANASLLYALTPVWTAVLSRLLHRERFPRTKIIGILSAVTGVVFVLVEKDFAFGPQHSLGNLLLLCASLTWALFTVLSQYYALHYGALPTTALSMLIGGILSLPLWYVLGAPLQLEQLTLTLWAELLYMGTVTSVLGYALWLIPLRYLELSRVAIFATLQPVLTTAAAIPLFGFTPTAPFLLGALLILTGVVLTQRH